MAELSCSNCSEVMPLNARFCAACGQPVAARDPGSSSDDLPVAGTVAEVVARIGSDGHLAMPPTETGKTTHWYQRRRWWAVAAAVVVIAAAGAAGGGGTSKNLSATNASQVGSVSTTTTNSPATSDTIAPTTTTDPPTTTAAPTTTTTSVPPTTAPPTTAPAAPSLTLSQQNAIESAQEYLNMGNGFSRAGLIQQLSSAAGDGYPLADATYAVDSLNVDWNAQAVLSAKDYLSMEAFSCSGLVDQLSSAAGEQFTLAQAQYGAKAAGVC